MLKNKLKAKAIFFDLDNTLLNSNKAQNNAICEFKNAYDVFLKSSNEQFTKIWDDITEEIYDRYLNKEMTFEKMRIERMKKIFSIYSINITDKEAKEKFQEYLKMYKKNWILFDDAKELLNYLKDKYKLGIISNGDTKNQREKIEYTGLDKYFSNINLSSEVGYSKPEKEIFETAYRKFNLKPENCIMIGDKYDIDIKGSLNVGMQAIWVKRRNEKNKYKYQVKELIEIKKLIL